MAYDPTDDPDVVCVADIHTDKIGRVVETPMD